MKQKLETQCDIYTTQKEIEKMEKLIVGAEKYKKDFYESVLKGFKARLLILKKRK